MTNSVQQDYPAHNLPILLPLHGDETLRSVAYSLGATPAFHQKIHLTVCFVKMSNDLLESKRLWLQEAIRAELNHQAVQLRFVRFARMGSYLAGIYEPFSSSNDKVAMTTYYQMVKTIRSLVRQACIDYSTNCPLTEKRVGERLLIAAGQVPLCEIDMRSAIPHVSVCRWKPGIERRAKIERGEHTILLDAQQIECRQTMTALLTSPDVSTSTAHHNSCNIV